MVFFNDDIKDYQPKNNLPEPGYKQRLSGKCRKSKCSKGVEIDGNIRIQILFNAALAYTEGQICEIYQCTCAFRRRREAHIFKDVSGGRLQEFLNGLVLSGAEDSLDGHFLGLEGKLFRRHQMYFRT